MACHERNDAEGGADRAGKGERREKEREREERGRVAAKGRRGDEPELERWQSIDLVGFTISFYLSLSFYISASPASLHELREGARIGFFLSRIAFHRASISCLSEATTREHSRGFFFFSFFLCTFFLSLRRKTERFTEWKLLGLRQRDEIRTCICVYVCVSLGLVFFLRGLVFCSFFFCEF